MFTWKNWSKEEIEGLPPVLCSIVGKASSQGMFFPPARNYLVALICYGSYCLLCRLDRGHPLGVVITVMRLPLWIR